MRAARRELSTGAAVTRYCPETGADVEIDVLVRGTWMPGEPGTLYDPPVPPGVEDVWAEANGQPFPFASYREADWAAELLSGEVT